jgi:hypothetical protein
MKTIFVNIPAYEDRFLYRTIEEAVSNATDSSRIFFAIALQYRDVPDFSKFSGDNFKYIHYDVDTRPGLTRVRHDLSRLHSGEDYFLMLDSHMRFEKDWDSKLIQSYSGLQESYGNKVIWSQPLPGMLGYGMTNVKETRPGFKESISIPRPDDGKDYWEYLFFPYGTQPVIFNEQKYMESHLTSSHFFFASAEFLSDVGITPIANSYQEEPFLYFSSYMSGWRVFKISEKNFIAHDNSGYNKDIYGDSLTPENYIYVKRFARERDPYNSMVAMQMALLFNEGPAKIKNAVMDPLEFYERNGLRKEYLVFKSLYLNEYEDLMKIACSVEQPML